MTRARDIASGINTRDDSGEAVPHIIPGVLYPAYEADSTGAGKLMDGTTEHGTGTYGGSAVSTDYGTTQSDGRKYYFTNIAGSKPIKDPRIGAHFGSQRHKFKSLQFLEQESATHGDEVYSVDGRDWIRRVGKFDVHDGYGTQGHFLGHTATSDATNSKYFEIVGYFNAANYLSYVSADRDVNVFIDGTQNPSSTVTTGSAVDTPLANRFVNSSSVINIPITGLTAPGIHTLKIANVTGDYLLLFGIELIAQDLSGTDSPNRSKIKFPAQSVVSYGKKHEITETNHHYDPFNGFVDDTTLFSAKVDTATSLGLGTATTWGAPWDTGSDDHIRPFNGGRVVKWVDSDGTIKTSVTMMPRNAQNIGTTQSNEITDVSSTNSHTINFSDDAVEHSLSEVAKTFHVKEFGNGSANGTITGSYPDVSMLDGNNRDIAYVMDDGCTSLSGTNGGTSHNATLNINGFVHYDSDYAYFTFIGTGVSITGATWDGTARYNLAIAQNLPYGTHIYKIDRNTTNTTKHFIDGVELSSVSQGSGHMISEITFHQPKRPPIPEDSVILADYMLMADYVKSATGGVNISKGIRLVSASRDMLHDTSSGSFGTCFTPNTNYQPFGVIGAFTTADQSAGVIKSKLPTFGTQFEIRQHNNLGDHFVDGSAVDHTNSSSHSGAYDTLTTQDNPLSLGLYTFESRNNASYHNITALGVVTPIHTSFHYQSFETPFLHELIGGDRNMEQTNLIVSPDGRSWDSLTRDTSYLGNIKCHMTHDDDIGWTSISVFTDWRGSVDGRNLGNKDFAIAYDRLICLVDGQYELNARTYTSGTPGNMAWRVNGTDLNISYTAVTDQHLTARSVVNLQRGDYVQLKGEFGIDGTSYNDATIVRL